MITMDQRCKRVHRAIVIGVVLGVLVCAPIIMIGYNTFVVKLLAEKK